MKKIILTIALFISLISVASAQFTIGPKVGLNISKEHYGNELIDDDIDFKRGINIGIFGKYYLNDMFDIQAELLYSQQGYKSDGILVDYAGSFTQNYKITSHYLNIPLVIKYYPFKLIYIEAGPQIGFCLDYKLSSNYSGIDELWDRYKDYNSVDFSLVGGIGIDIGYGLNVSARYNHGLTHTLPNTDFKNRVIQFSLTYNLWEF